MQIYGGNKVHRTIQKSFYHKTRNHRTRSHMLPESRKYNQRRRVLYRHMCTQNRWTGIHLVLQQKLRNK